MSGVPYVVATMTDPGRKRYGSKHRFAPIPYVRGCRTLSLIGRKVETFSIAYCAAVGNDGLRIAAPNSYRRSLLGKSARF
jgi:hypothetical protein